MLNPPPNHAGRRVIYTRAAEDSVLASTLGAAIWLESPTIRQPAPAGWEYIALDTQKALFHREDGIAITAIDSPPNSRHENLLDWLEEARKIQSLPAAHIFFANRPDWDDGLWLHRTIRLAEWSNRVFRKASRSGASLFEISAGFPPRTLQNLPETREQFQDFLFAILPQYEAGHMSVLEVRAKMPPEIPPEISLKRDPRQDS